MLSYGLFLAVILGLMRVARGGRTDSTGVTSKPADLGPLGHESRYGAALLIIAATRATAAAQNVFSSQSQAAAPEPQTHVVLTWPRRSPSWWRSP